MVEAPPLAVTDADRSEAADLLLIVGFSLEYIAETKAGSHDDHAFVQAFARHRLSTQTPNAAALVGADLAKRMAESVGLDWSKLPDQPDAACGYGMPEGCKSYWLRLAALSSTPSKAAAAARQALAASSPPTQGSGGGVDRYLANRFEFAAPGDRQYDAWLLRFCDQDRREAIWTGPDAEAEAWAAWEQYAPTYNCYVFRIARLSSTPSNTQGALEAAARDAVLEEAAKVAEQRRKYFVVGPDVRQYVSFCATEAAAAIRALKGPTNG